MLRPLPLAVLILLIPSCRHTSETSAPKSLQYVSEKTLISLTTVDVSKGEPLSLVIDGTSGKPTPDAKFFVSSITLTLEQVDSEEVCGRSLKALETRGEQGTIPYVLADHEEDSNSFIYANKLNMVPIVYNELLFHFEADSAIKDKKKRKVTQCRIGVVADGHWSTVGDIGYASVSDDPERDAAIREFGSAYEHRLSHYMWHSSRGLWPNLNKELATLKAQNLTAEATEASKERMAVVEKSIAQYKAAGWAPPRYFRDTDEETGLTGAGEDFFYMHRQMLARLSAYLKSKGLKMVPAWTELPKPGDKNFPLGPKDQTEFADMKSDEYFYATQSIWEKAYQAPIVNAEALAEELLAYRQRIKKGDDKEPTLEEAKTEVALLLEPRPAVKFNGLKGISLSEYGHLLEMTIHNNLHTRFAFDSASRPADADPLDKAAWDKDWSRAFDGTSYDWLGDTYASHVHPWFYRIHGWIDARIGDWLAANDFQSIGTREECEKAAKPCYIWLSDDRYRDKGDGVPWEGPLMAAKDSSGQKATSLHAHAPLAFTPDVIAATRGLRAQYATMNRVLINPKLQR